MDYFIENHSSRVVQNTVEDVIIQYSETYYVLKKNDATLHSRKYALVS